MRYEKIWQADYQQVLFRQLVNAFSYPGTTQTLANKSASASLSVVATLVDGATSLSDPHQLITEADLLRLQVGLSSPDKAAYVLCAGDKAVDFQPLLGSLESPDQSATLIIKVTALQNGDQRLNLKGPGIKEGGEIAPKGLHGSWLSQRQEWNAAFPLGVDIILVTDDQFLAIPRTTQIKEGV
ncbi:MAG: phosphonate C-P lyase system protein PhnH [Methyloprofundus sp.]|nr:phosphonate C-P lyase system protein PhnH [Methyloprofundus sp.]